MGNTNYGMWYLIFISFVAALGGFLFGYDTAVISGTIGQVAERFSLDTIDQGWYVGCALLGSIGGVMCAGVLGDKFGRKKSMIISAVLFTASALGCALAPDFSWLVFYRIIGGMGIGVASIICPLYISEIAVPEYRGSLVSLYQLAITVGFIGAYAANYFLLQYSLSGAQFFGVMQLVLVDEVWRGMLGMETLPAFFFFAVVFIIPESPRWLMVRGREEAAAAIFAKTVGRDNVESEMRAVSAAVGDRHGSEWRLLFSPGIFKALLIGVAIAILGQFMGVNAVLYYGPEIFEDAGLSSGDSLLYQLGIGMVNTGTTIIALFIIDKVGRKSLVYFGVSGMIVSLLLIAFYFAFGAWLGISPVVLLVFFLFYIFCCAISICAVVWVLLSEMYPIKVRGVAMSVAGLSLWIGTYLIGQLTPWLLETLTPAGTFVLFAVMCIPYMLIMWRLVPETSGRSLEEIEKYWTK